MPAPKRKPATAAKTTPARANKLEDKLVRLGLRSDMDLVLHLPLPHEEETQVVSISQAGFMTGYPAQVEGVVTACDIQFRPRRQLVVTIEDESSQLVMRFLNFYGSQVKQLAAGTRVRARGEVRHGFFGEEMVHPAYKVILEGAPLPMALPPVYPAGEGLSQALLRKAIAGAMSRVDWRDTLAEPLLASLG